MSTLLLWGALLGLAAFLCGMGAALAESVRWQTRVVWGGWFLQAGMGLAVLWVCVVVGDMVGWGED